jgi:hypothetical protein
MKLKVFGDLHLTGNNIIDVPIINFLKDNIAKDDTVVFLGDIFDTFNISVQYNIFYDYLSTVKNTVYIILGNHDFSQNRCWSIPIKNFVSNIKIIKEYEYVDINNKLRLHFYNYFKKNIKQFNVKDDGFNMLFSHSDLVVTNPYPEYSVMNLCVNGHQHDFDQSDKYINLGAIRQCKIDENSNKRLLIFDTDTLQYEFINFDTVIDIKQYFAKDIDNITIEKHTILNILLCGYQNPHDVMEQIKQTPWYNKDSIIIRFVPFIDKTVINNILIEISKNNNLNLNTIFEEYLKIYEEKFKIQIENKEEVCDLFKKIYEEKGTFIKDLFHVYPIELIELQAENFKLFRSLNLNFTKYNEITSIVGNNYDELNNMNLPSSNESGKSNIRNMLEYVLGTSNDKNVLTYNEKKGWVSLQLKINDDSILIKKKYNKNVSELEITINNERQWENETPTNVMKMFYEKYNIQNAIPYILVSDTGMARYFFSSKNSEKFKMFRNIFPIIETVSSFIKLIDEDVKLKEIEFNNIQNKKNVIKDKRKDKSTFYWNTYNRLYLEKSKLKVNEIQDKINKLTWNKTLLEQENDLIYINKILSKFSIHFWNKIIDLKNNYEVQNIMDSHDEFYKSNEILNYYNINKLESKNRIKKIEEELSSLKLELEKINIGNCEYLNLDLNKIKDNLIKAGHFEHITKTYKDYNKIFDIECILNDLKLKESKVNKSKEELNSLKEKYINKENDLKELKENAIKCPNCDFEIYDIKTQEKLTEELLDIKKQGVDKKSEHNKYLEEYNDYNTNIYLPINEINEDILYYFDEQNLTLKQFKEYLLNPFNYDNITLENIEELIKTKNDYNVNKTNYDNLTKQITKLNLDLDSEQKKLFEKETKIEEIKNNLKPYNKEDYEKIISVFREYSITKNDYFVTLEKINDVLSKNILNEFTQDEINNLDNLMIELDNAKKTKKLFDDLNVELKYEKQKEDNLNKDYNNLCLDIKKTKKELNFKDINIKLKEVEDQFKKYELLYNILTSKRVFNFEKFFINQFFEKMNNIFNAFLKVLFDRNVELVITENDFSFIDCNNSDVDFNAFSNGAKTKIESCLLFTINILFYNMGIRSNFLWIDELMDKGVDQVNLSRLFEVLIKFFKDKKIFVVSHKDIEEYCQNKIVVERHNGSSILI